MCVSFVVVIISSVLVVKGSMITEDPPLCALLDAATQCEDLEIAKLCTQLCTPAEDSPLCLFLDAATQCDNEIAKICPNLCTPDQNWRDDYQCGPENLAPNGEPAICPGWCCSNHGWCGSSSEFCDCHGCTDYTEDKCSVSEGFLLSPDGTECYIAIRDEKRSWSAADSFCKSEGLMLAQPADRNVPWLQKTLNKKYGGSEDDWPWYWVGARGSGSGSYVWQQQQQQQQQGGGGQVNTNMWIPGYPNSGGTTVYCVVLTAFDYRMTMYPGRPYYDAPCSTSSYPICQKVLV